MWYAHPLVYHTREGDERDDLAEHIRSTVRKARQTEVTTMRQTIAEALEAEGKAEGKAEGTLEAKRDTLLRQLRVKFEKKVPARIEATVRATSDLEKLDNWLKGVVTAEKLADIPFDNGR